MASLCLEYLKAVKNACADVTRLKSRLGDLGANLQAMQHLLNESNNQALATSQRLINSIDGCTLKLVQLQSKLELGKAQKAMRRFGLRALKWPFDSNETNAIISNLESYQQTITLGLQINQT